MSTVDKATADKVIAGEFPEDDIAAIVEYENMFNGAKAYKLVRHGQIAWLDNLDAISPAMRNCKLYWHDDGIVASPNNSFNTEPK
jgi:hypothetical protein